MSEASWQPGRVQWRELMTNDADRARGFYGELLGWTFRTSDMGDGFLYSLIANRGQDVGGLYTTPPGVNAPSHWSSYVSVTDVDATCATAVASGGRIVKTPMDLPGVGRMAAIADPDGAVIWMFRSDKGDPTPRVGTPTAGEFCWETLLATDLPRAKQFYATLFGWEAPAGPMPVFSLAGDPTAMIADYQQAHAVPSVRAAWLTYVVVDDLAATRDRAVSLGGAIKMRELVVPNIGAYGVIVDPTGGVLGLFAPQRAAQ